MSVLESPAHRSAANAGRWQAVTEPRSDGLPNRLVLWWFPSLLAAVFVLLVVAGVSGTSNGIWRQALSGGSHDSHVIAGEPRSIRSDEWLVQGSWLISAKAQGFASQNQVFPGGADATVMNDTPTWDWSTAFRPHLWGSLALDLDRGLAWRWWLPAGALMASVYAFVVAVLPRRPLLAATLAMFAFFQPYVQWTYLPVLTLSVTFAFVAMTAVRWGLRAADRRSQVVPAIVAGYAATAMAMSIYAPFMLDAGYVVVAFVLGEGLQSWRNRQMPGSEVIRRQVPLATAALVSGLVMVAWALTRWDTVRAVFNTVYPGHRSAHPGMLGLDYLVSMFGAPFDGALQRGVSEGLGGNQSGGASTYLVSVFLLVPLAWFAARRWRRSRQMDWPVVAFGLVQLFLFAVLFLPGWNSISRLFLVDRANPTGMKVCFVMLAVVSVVLLVERQEEDAERASWVLAGTTGLCAAVASALVWARLAHLGSAVVPSALALVLAVAFAVAVGMWARGFALTGAVLALGCTLLVGAGVNPLYRGVFNAATDTQAGREMLRLHAAQPQARWVGVGNWIAMATVFEAGVPGYSGVQTYPADQMWHQIDPSGRSEGVWNRLAHIHWSPGQGGPAPRNVGADVIELTFDSCARFAQRHVSYILNVGRPLQQRCLQEVGSYREGATLEQVYRVVAP